MDVTITIRISEEDKKKVNAAAEKSSRSMSDYVRLVILEAVKEGKTV